MWHPSIRFVSGAVIEGFVLAALSAPPFARDAFAARVAIGGSEIRVSDSAVLPDPGNGAFWLKVVSHGDGVSLLAWTSMTDSEAMNVYGRTLDGATLGPTRTLSDDTAGNQRGPTLAAWGDGYLVAFNSDHLAAKPEVFLRELDAGGDRVGSQFRVNTDNGCSSEVPWQVAVTGEGKVLVTWSSYGCPSQPALVARGRGYDASLSALFLPTDLYPTGHVVRAAALSGDRFMAVWRGDSDPEFRPRARTVDLGPPPVLGTAFSLVETLPAGEGNQPQSVLKLAGSDDVLVIWDSRIDSSTVHVRGRRFHAPDYSGDTTFDVASISSAESAAGQPYAARLSDGNVVVVWGEPDSDGLGVVGQIIDTTGAPLGAKFQVNATEAGDQIFPDVSADPDGGFTVAWIGDSEDGRAVFARHFLTRDGEIYFTGGTLPRISRATAPCFTPETVVGPQEGAAYGPLAIDHLHGKLYYGVYGDTATHGIRRSGLDGSGEESLVEVGAGNTVGGISLDPDSNLLCWSVGGGGVGSIWCSDLQGTNSQQVLTVPPGPAIGYVEIDAAGGKLYWSSSDGLSLARANLDGSSMETVVSSLCSPRNFVLDKTNNRIFVANENLNGPCFAKIQKVDFAGPGFSGSTTVTDLFAGSETIGWPEDIALDASSATLFWSGLYHQGVFRGQVDGSGLAEPVRGLGGHFNSIALSGAVGTSSESCSCGNCADSADNDGDGLVDDSDPLCVDGCGLPTCGNATLEPGEVCDDGNTANGDCCSSDCQAVAACDDGSPCTVDFCDMETGACRYDPRPRSDCREARSSAVQFSLGNGGKVKWKWQKGKASYCSEIGDPIEDVTVCVWDQTALDSYVLASEFTIPSSSFWANQSEDGCYWKYTDSFGTLQGMRTVRVNFQPDGSEGDQSSISLQAKGQDAPIPDPVVPASPGNKGRFFAMNPSLTVQMLSSSNTDLCWGTTYTESFKNFGDKFKTQRKIQVLP